MKRLSILAAALTMMASSCVMAKNLNGYQDVLAAMKSGKIVFALVNYDKCTVKQKSNNTYNIDTHSIGVRMDRLFELTESRDDGKRMNVIGFVQHNWNGNQDYALSRQLIHVWEDNTVDFVDDSVDPATFKLQSRDWVRCTANGSVTFSVA